MTNVKPAEGISALEALRFFISKGLQGSAMLVKSISSLHGEGRQVSLHISRTASANQTFAFNMAFISDKEKPLADDEEAIQVLYTFANELQEPEDLWLFDAECGETAELLQYVGINNLARRILH